MSYESPIELYIEQVRDNYEKTAEEEIMKAVCAVSANVDRDELVKALQYDRDQYDKGYHDGLNVNKWISTKDMMPPLFERVIVSFKHRCVNFASLVIGEGGYKYWMLPSGSVFWYDSVIAWQPLPEPYKEEE